MTQTLSRHSCRLVLSIYVNLGSTKNCINYNFFSAWNFFAAYICGFPKLGFELTVACSWTYLTPIRKTELNIFVVDIPGPVEHSLASHSIKQL